jgi:ubiquinone/menaquinone biosynthesis C-methylase UbiE
MNDHTRIQSYLYKELDPAFARRAAVIAEHIAPFSHGHVLEIGCGRGFYEGFLTTLYPSLFMTALDQNDEYLAVAKTSVDSTSVKFLKADALHLPFKKHTFDAAIATEVLEHLDDHRALHELFRVVKPGGTVIISVPNSQYPFLWDPLNWMLKHLFGTHVSKDIWWLAGIWADHVRLYTQEDLEKVIKEEGYTLETLYRSTHACIPASHFLLYGIGKNIVEKGFLKDFYRFNAETKPSVLLHFVRSIIYARDYVNKKTESRQTATVNLIAVLRKP